jgi:hypothetical protein
MWNLWSCAGFRFGRPFLSLPGSAAVAKAIPSVSSLLWHKGVASLPSRSSSSLPPITVQASPSHRATNQTGYSLFLQSGRSVLHHPVGLPLFCLLNESMPPSAEENVNDLFGNNEASSEIKRLLELHPDSGKFETIIKNWASKKDSKELNLTGGLYQEMNELLQKTPTRLRATHQKQIAIPGGTYFQYDILVQQPAPATADTAPAAILVEDILIQHSTPATEDTAPAAAILVEAGVKNDCFWQKFHQGMSYITLIKRCSGPMLLTVVTVSGEMKPEIDALVGTFLVSPIDGTNRFRISLLSRSRFLSAGDMARGFGRILRAAVCLEKWREDLLDGTNYVYLGPNCCKIGEKVCHGHMIYRTWECFAG